MLRCPRSCGKIRNGGLQLFEIGKCEDRDSAGIPALGCPTGFPTLGGRRLRQVCGSASRFNLHCLSDCDLQVSSDLFFRCNATPRKSSISLMVITSSLRQGPSFQFPLLYWPRVMLKVEEKILTILSPRRGSSRDHNYAVEDEPGNFDRPPFIRPLMVDRRRWPWDPKREGSVAVLPILGKRFRPIYWPVGRLLSVLWAFPW
jgi:hypothetical protein